MKATSTLFLAFLASVNANEMQKRHRRALNAVRSNYLEQIGRNLASSECEASQITIEESRINESFAAISGDEEELPLYCDIEMTTGSIRQYCDFSQSDISIDTMDCSAMGGSVKTLSLETNCAEGLMVMTLESLNLCISKQCTEFDFEQELEEGLNEAFKEEEGLTCHSDVQFNPYLKYSGSPSTANLSWTALGLVFFAVALI